MRLYSLIGSVGLLLLPFSYISYEVGNFASITSFLGLLWFSSETDFIGFQNSGSETFQLDWLQEGGVYYSYFEPLFLIGVLILIGTIANIIFSLISSEKQNKNMPGFLLIALGITLFLVRLVALGDDDLSYYSSEDTFLGGYTYLEIPIGFLVALIFGILDLRN